MVKRSTILKLPRLVRERLDTQLLECGFSDYTALADWLEQEGHNISRSSIQRYGKQLERRIEEVRLATLQAEALISASPDDQGAVADGALRQVQTRIFNLMLAADSGDLKELSACAKALAETARASLALRVDRRKVLAEAGQAAVAEAKRQGLSEAGAAKIEQSIKNIKSKDD